MKFRNLKGRCHISGMAPENQVLPVFHSLFSGFCSHGYVKALYFRAAVPRKEGRKVICSYDESKLSQRPLSHWSTLCSMATPSCKGVWGTNHFNFGIIPLRLPYLRILFLSFLVALGFDFMIWWVVVVTSFVHLTNIY